MRLIRFGAAGKEKPGIINKEGKYIDVSAFGEDYSELFFETNGLKRLATWLAKNEAQCPQINTNERLGPPTQRPSKLVCIGLNYAQHAKESGMQIPPEPVIFFKASSSVTGPNDDLIIPRNSQKTDWEVELAFVMEKKASYVSEEEAMDYVAGYVLHNDYSEREFQMERSGQWVKGKSCDTFAPLGPFLATKDEIPDPHKLNLWLKVNGQMMQNSSTSDMVYKIPFLVSYISNFMSLLPGDIVSTGTPFGVGLGLNPPRFIKEGDVIELGIEGLGSSRQAARNYSS
jgi:2-keto-4-pentenoate hydratase/2-oxohepta-3-ene-1,7-dioic acid hydratase in catechol pathway